jgi:NMD protein affecting ribosome stability and mRNA decay
MKVKCAERGEVEAPGLPILVCHHCGKPVCARHALEVTRDEAFASTAAVPVSAVHCAECKGKYHRGMPTQRRPAADDDRAEPPARAGASAAS